MSTTLLTPRNHRTTQQRPTRRCRPHDRSAPSLPVLVSATSMDTDGEVRGMARPRVPNYRLRRVMVGSAAAGVVVAVAAIGLLAAVGVLGGFGASPVSAAPAPFPLSADVADAPAATAVHVAEPDDTMWSIADAYRGSVDRDRFLDALIRLNGGTTVQAGQAVWLP